MRNKNFSFSSKKGYYIALILCAAAIGISGYLYYRSANHPEQMEKPGVQTQGTVPGKDVQAIATSPTEIQTENPTKPQTVTKPIKTAAPLDGETVAAYAMDALAYNQTTRDWRVHNGVDIAAEAGTPVRAAADGTVYTVYEDDRMGVTVVIRHGDGYTTRYSSLAKPAGVKAGDTVKLGQTIGKVGNTALLETATGDHIHFSVTKNDTPVDPEKFLTNP